MEVFIEEDDNLDLDDREPICGCSDCMCGNIVTVDDYICDDCMDGYHSN
jgi:hypothetical protein